MFPQGRKEGRLDHLSPSRYHDHGVGKATVSVSGADMASISYRRTIFYAGSVLQASALHLNSTRARFAQILLLNPERQYLGLTGRLRRQTHPSVASAQPILNCQLGLAHCDSHKIGTSVPQLERRGESKCTSGRTNIDCNSIGVPRGKVRAAWVPPHARPCTVDDVEFYHLKLIQHVCNVTCRPMTLWPSNGYCQRGLDEKPG